MRLRRIAHLETFVAVALEGVIDATDGRWRTEIALQSSYP
jgi:hypothetical protein